MRIAKIFANGRSQAVRLPKEFRFEETEVLIKKIDDMVILIPKNSVWQTFESSLHHFSDDYLTDRQQPDLQLREDH